MCIIIGIHAIFFRTSVNGMNAIDVCVAILAVTLAVYMTGAIGKILTYVEPLEKVD